MNLSIKKYYLFPLFILVSHNALMANPLDNISKNWYVGGNIGRSNMSPDGKGVWNIDEGSDIGAKVYVGTNISRQVSLEGFWTDLGATKLSSNTGQKGSINYKAIGANLVYHSPYKVSNIRPLAKLGVAKFNNKDKGKINSEQKHMLTIFGGVGLEYDLSKNLTVRSEFEYYDKDINQISVGLKWSPQYNDHSFLRPKKPVIPITPAPEKITEIVPVYIPKVEVVPVYIPAPKQKPVIIKQTIIKPPTIIKAKPVIIKPAPPPKPKPPQYRIVHRTLSGGSHFASGSAALTFDGKDALNRLAHDLNNKNMNIKQIQITGHTDSVGSQQANQVLSYNRAQSVASYLANRGVSRQLIQAQGRGESQPIANNKTKHGRAQNRRVEIKIKGSSKQLVRN